MELRQHDSAWSQQFEHERGRLLDVLGVLPERGIIEHIEHIGASSVAGVLAQPIVDIGLSVWPFPLELHRQTQLEELGYELAPGYEAAPEQRFHHVSKAFHLHIVDAGSELWTNYLVVRDYLRHDQKASQSYSATKQAIAEQAGDNDKHYEELKDQLLRQIVGEGHTWWVDFYGFGAVQAVVQEFNELNCSWYISSGWALDLFLGRVSRVHHDVDVVIARSDQLLVQQHLQARGWKFVTPFEGKLEPWPAHMYLESPRHQVHAHRNGQFIDILFGDIRNGIWHYRREPAVIRAVERIKLQNNDGVPFLAPELVLLFKSKNTSGQERPKDAADYLKVRDNLEPERRSWLRWALLLADPEHPWIAELI